MKDFEDKCLGTTHKISYLPQESTHILNVFKYLCISQYSLLNFICFSCFIVSFFLCLSFVFHYLIFDSKIALWPIGYAVKMLVAKMLVAKVIMAKVLDTDCIK